MSLRTGSRRERAATRRARGAARAYRKKHLRDVSVRGSLRAAIYGRLRRLVVPGLRARLLATSLVERQRRAHAPGAALAGRPGVACFSWARTLRRLSLR
jgi:hypothetical protein